MSNDFSTLSANGNMLLTNVYVDYECWAFGMRNQFNSETDIEKWFKDVKTVGKINEVYFFGSFEKKVLGKDQAKIRMITNNIITTDSDGEKDYTDFIILDKIYQDAMKNESLQQYIIFSGDGHFSSACAFLKNFYDKTVGAYAVQGTLSDKLYKSANWAKIVAPSDIRSYEIPVPHHECGQKKDEFINALLGNLWRSKSQKGLIPTFNKTVEIVAKKNGLDTVTTSSTLSELVRTHYIRQIDKDIDDGRKIRALEPDWDMITKDGLWQSPKESV